MAFIVDGNNFLGFSAAGGARDPENRRSLVRKLLAFQKFTGTRVFLVFDGRLTDDLIVMAAGEGKFRLIQPPLGENADGVILDLIDRQTDRRRLFVVSSDREIRTYAHDAGASPLTCREFEARLKRVLKERRAAKEMGKPAVRTSPLEVGLWLDVFGEKKR